MLKFDKNANPHPGILLRQNIINANDLTVKRASELLGISNVQLSYIANGRHGLSAEFCQRLAIVFNQNAEDWMALQAQYELSKAASKISNLGLQPFKKK